MDRLEMIGEIRRMWQTLQDHAKFELCDEIMGYVHRDNFTGVSEAAVRRMWLDMCDATRRLPGEQP